MSEPGTVTTVVALPSGDDAARIAGLALTTGDVFYALRVRPDVACEFVSPTVAALMSCSVAEVMADPTRLLADSDEPAGSPAVDDGSTRSLLSTEPGQERRAVVRRRLPDGRLRYLEHRVRALARPDGSVVLEGCARDVTSAHDAQQLLAESESRYRFLAREVGDVVALDAVDGAPLWVSPSIERLLGWTPAEVIGGQVELFHPDDVAVAQDMLGRLLAGDDIARGRIRVRHRTAGFRWTDSVARAVRGDDGRVQGYVVVTRDVHEQVMAEKRRGEAEEAARLDRAVLRGVMDAMLDPLVLLAAVRDRDGRLLDFVCVDANPAAERAFGAPRDAVVGGTLRRVVPGPDGERVFARLSAVVAEGEPLVADAVRYVGPRVGCDRILVDARAVRVGDGLSLTWRDVTAAHEAAERLEFLASHDPLTSLANRHDVMRRLAAVLAHPPRAGTGVAVLYVDLDGLKPLNDTYGHAVGDAVLVAVGRRLTAAVRVDDVVARIGGDEFLVALTEVASGAAATLVAEKIHRAVAAPMDVDGRTLQVTVSIGIALAEPGDDVDAVIYAADQALYEAKHGGRDRTATARTRRPRG